MITKEDIRDGISNGTIQFIIDPNMKSGTVCEIDENWFYFGGQTAEDENPEDYLAHVPIEEIVQSIFDVLEDLKEMSKFEYRYYEDALREGNSLYVTAPLAITRKMQQSREIHISHIIERVNGYILKAVEEDRHACYFACDKNNDEDAPFYDEVKERFEKAGYKIRVSYGEGSLQRHEIIMW